MAGFGLLVRFVLRDGHAEAFDALVRQTLDGIRSAEPGTLVYASHTVADEPRQRIFYEIYRDRAAFEAHEEQEHVKHFLQARGEHVESFTVDFLDITDAKGIALTSADS
jgi:quinol monooxygenase YgiN